MANVITDQTPLVTVLVPSYNHERFISQCLQSILDQTYQNLELIVIDDGSKDTSPEILQKLQNKHHFKLILQENRGTASVLNMGLEKHSQGKYVSFCASDDYWVPEKIELQVKFMEEHPEFAMCYGKNYFVDDHSQIIDRYCRDYGKLKGGSVFNELFLFRFHPQVNYLFRRSIFEETGYYDERFITEDYYMNLKIAYRHPIGFIDSFLGYYRIPSSPLKIGRFEQLTRSHLGIIENYHNHPLYRQAIRRAYLRNFDTYSGFTRYKVKAVQNLLRSLPLFYEKRFIVATIKLLFIFKSL